MDAYTFSSAEPIVWNFGWAGFPVVSTESFGAFTPQPNSEGELPEGVMPEAVWPLEAWVSYFGHDSIDLATFDWRRLRFRSTCDEAEIHLGDGRVYTLHRTTTERAVPGGNFPFTAVRYDTLIHDPASTTPKVALRTASVWEGNFSSDFSFCSVDVIWPKVANTLVFSPSDRMVAPPDNPSAAPLVLPGA